MKRFTFFTISQPILIFASDLNHAWEKFTQSGYHASECLATKSN
ncbi:hypothetical protein [Pseudomonas serbica]|jgi:hypothetical protein|nr:hypothetical protein [Pseudomonas serbica]